MSDPRRYQRMGVYPSHEAMDALEADDHADMVHSWLAECDAKGWDPETGEVLGPDSAPSPWMHINGGTVDAFGNEIDLID